MKIYDNGPLPMAFYDIAYNTSNETEFALPRSEAIKYIEWCKEQSIEVIGFDTWAPTTPGPTVYEKESIEGDGQLCIKKLKALNLEDIKTEIGYYPLFNIWTNYDAPA